MVQVYGKFVHYDQRSIHEYLLPVVPYTGDPIQNRDVLYRGAVPVDAAYNDLVTIMLED